ncbi:MAG: cyclic nucleotide-binding domain-containing protein [Betaproteobacteria bacterium]|nr:cyclic nucleotide-binding domain-containing protein [Betaproteobacteria bacterium]
MFRDLPEVIPLSAGDYVFRKGEPGKTMYLIIEGEIDLLAGTKVVETADEGSFIGEMALIEDAPRSASARARTEARVFPIDNTRFQSLVKETPSFALDLMQTLASRLRRATAKIAHSRKANSAHRPPGKKHASGKKRTRAGKRPGAPNLRAKSKRTR